MSAPPVIPDHTLLRVIGRGSYGEVWLANNVMGTLRAVKIVRRDAFDSDRPYLREFEGIRRCEPVSRAHDGLVDILHMGRSDAEGWFYYVMELADGADQTDQSDRSDPSDHSTYRPATLAARLAPGKMLDITECLRIAESLAGALAFLHEQGLIHRDVKPSNVLYAGGVPKLGDIGLVAEAGSSRSFVGTEGFVPQEGPGTERADIYALGKVLYEALTGMDRSKFPLLPAEWRGAYDFDQRVELNEIVLRACEGQRDRRYATAREMLADVALVASGRSVKKLRGMEGRLRLLKWAGLAAAAVALTAVSISWLGREQAEKERALRLRAEKAESAALEERYAAMLGRVSAARRDPSSGAVAAALAAAKELAALHPTPELRDEVAFLLGRSDLVPREDLSVSVDGRPCAVHPGTGRVVIARQGPDAGLTLQFSTAGSRDAARDVVIANPPANFLWPEFSPDGKRLLLLGWWGAGVVLDAASGSVLTEIPVGTELTSLLRWCGPDGARLLRRSSSGALAFYTVPGGERSLSPVVDWPVPQQRAPSAPTPSPDGKSVLLIHRGIAPENIMARVRGVLLPDEPPPQGGAALVECETGRILWNADGPDDQSAAWSADGTRLALRAGGRIHLHDAATGAVTASVPQRIYNDGTRMSFLGSRDVLAFSTWSHSGSYDAVQQQFTPGLPCSPVHFDEASQVLWAAEKSSGVAAAQWQPSKVLRVLESRAAERSSVRLAFSPDGAQLIISNGAEFRSHDLHAADTPPRVWPAPGAAAVSFPGGTAAEYYSQSGVHRSAWSAEMPAALPSAQPTTWPGAVDFTASSADGTVTAAAGPRWAAVQSGGAVRRFTTTDIGNPVSLSPDGRWFALGSQHSGLLRVWDLSLLTDEAPAHVQQGTAGAVPAFSPDGQWLACAMEDANLLLRPGTWETVHRFPRRGGSIMSYPAFSATSQRAVLKADHNTFEVRDTRTFALLYHLRTPSEEQLGRTVLSADGRHLAAVGARQEIYVWDLSALEESLSRMGMLPPEPTQ